MRESKKNQTITLLRLGTPYETIAQQVKCPVSSVCWWASALRRAGEVLPYRVDRNTANSNKLDTIKKIMESESPDTSKIQQISELL